MDLELKYLDFVEPKPQIFGKHRKRLSCKKPFPKIWKMLNRTHINNMITNKRNKKKTFNTINEEID